jgi:hypothetical protein
LTVVAEEAIVKNDRRNVRGSDQFICRKHRQAHADRYFAERRKKKLLSSLKLAQKATISVPHVSLSNIVSEALRRAPDLICDTKELVSPPALVCSSQPSLYLFHNDQELWLCAVQRVSQYLTLGAAPSVISSDSLPKRKESRHGGPGLSAQEVNVCGAVIWQESMLASTDHSRPGQSCIAPCPGRGKSSIRDAQPGPCPRRISKAWCPGACPGAVSSSSTGHIVTSAICWPSEARTGSHRPPTFSHIHGEENPPLHQETQPGRRDVAAP